MVQSFKKDIFSKSKIRWTSNINKEDLYKIKIIVKNNIISSKLSIKQNGGMEINSNNFKLISKSKKFILKRWSKKMKISEIYKIIEIINWLNKKKIKTPIIQKFKNNKKVIKYEKEYWSYFNYIEGNHFKGKLKEMKNVASYLGSFLNELKRYSFTKNKREYKYYTKDDENILKFLKNNLTKLDKFFSKEHSMLIKDNLSEIIRLFKKFKKLKLKKKTSHIIHMDVHPHNIITKNGKLNAFIDIDSCVRGEIAYALSYAMLKICKQTFIYNKKKIGSIKIKNSFLNEIKKTYKINKIIEDNLYYYAISEVIRRLIEMFRFTIKNNNRKWNHVIPIQLGHLSECKDLFLNRVNQ